MILITKTLKLLLAKHLVYHYMQITTKFAVVTPLPDGSYMSWIAPDRKSQRKGATRIPVRVIEYTIEEDETPQRYRLMTDLVDLALFPA